MKEFKNYHPIVSFIYFAFIIGFSVCFMHPLCLMISFLCGILYSFALRGFDKTKKSFLYIIPVILLASFINPLFNHEGATVLLYFPNGNPLTAESLIYGFFASVMLGSVIIWFSLFNEIMTSDKIIYLFGKISPSISLVFSMTLSFIPKFIKQFKNVYNIQKSMKNEKKFRLLVTVFSIMITWSLENAIETADSMKARGYGEKKRTAFSIYNFSKRDLSAIIFILISGIYMIFGIITKKLEVSYFPAIKMADVNIYFLVYFLMCFMPLIIEASEVKKWKSIK